MLFAFIVDHFLRQMDWEIDILGWGTTRACADDIGAAISSISVLAVYKPIFDSAADLAGLVLKPKKCVRVPLAARFAEETTNKIKAYSGLAELPSGSVWDVPGFRVGASRRGLAMD